MPEQNLDRTRRIFEEWSRGDFSQVWWVHPEIEVINAPDVPEPGVRVGPDSMAEMWRSWLGAWVDFRVVAERFVDGGDHVLVLGHFTGRGKESGVAIDGRPAGTVFTFRDGVVVRLALFVDHDSAAQEFGRLTSAA